MQFLINPLTVYYLVIVVLDVVIAVYLALRPRKSQTDWLLAALFGLMAGGKLCSVVASALVGDGVEALHALSYPFLLGAFAVHLHFAYTFLDTPFPRESRVVTRFWYGLAALLALHPAWSGSTGLLTGATPQPFGAGLTHSVFLIVSGLTLMFVWSLVVYLRKTVHSTRAASDVPVAWWRAIAHPVGREARAHRAFLLPWALLFPPIVSSTVLLVVVGRSEGGMVAFVLDLARACAFVLVYLTFAPKPTSLRVKLSGTALVATLAVCFALFAVLYPPSTGLVNDLSLQQREIVHAHTLPALWVLLLATAAVLIGFPLLLRSSLTAPVARLLAGIRRVDAGERDVTVPVGAGDEIGQVTHHFNRMTASLAASEAELRAHAEHLEARVSERTAELEAEKAKTEAQAARLAELDEAKSRFFANVSHEFRTPLTLLLGPLRDAVASETREEPLARHLPAMHRSAERLLSLVDELLDLARLDAGRLRLRVAEHDLIALTRRIVFAFASRAEREGLALGFESGPERLDAWVDAERVEQILSNLLTNAFKFTPEGGRVRVTLDVDDGAAVLTVRDTGEGIPAAVLPYVFERFRQADDASTRRNEGAGIGLALVHELVTLHGGTVAAESTAGFGSTFTVRLPLGKEHVDAEAFAPADTLEAPSTPLIPEDAALEDVPAGTPDPSPTRTDATILIVEDHEDMRAYLRDLLAPHYHVEEAENGHVGLEAARRLAAEGKAPDLVLSDVMMPGLDGYALCHALKEDAALGHVPVVLLTARADEESKLEGLGEGADDYLAKPFSAEELLARCENLIEVRCRLRARFSGEVVVRPSDIVVEREEADWLEDVKAICEAHLSDAGFGVDWLADELDLSARQLRRRTKAASGLTPGAFLRTMRLARAAQLLEQGAGSVTEVAAAVGYTDAESFSRAFRQGFGVPPSAYAETSDRAESGS